MKLIRGLGISARALLAHKLRAALALSSVAVSVAAVVVVSAIGTGAEKEIVRQAETMGTNLLVVRPAQVRNSAARKLRGVVPTLTEEDYEAIRELAAVEAAVPGFENTLTAKAGSGSMSVRVLGTTSAYLQVCRFALKRGRFLDEDDNLQARRVAVLGARVDEELFPGQDAIGHDIRIRGVPFAVIGALRAKGILADGSDQDNQILIPIRTALQRVFNLTWLNPIFVSVRDSNKMTTAETEMAQLLRVRHHLEPGGRPDDFSIQNKTKILATQKQIADSLTNLALGLAGVSLLIGGIGILALMLMSVKERTGEIGLRIAVGARPGDILLQFLAEAALLAAGGWLAGLILGLLGADGRFLRAMEGRPFTRDAARLARYRGYGGSGLWNLARPESLLNSTDTRAADGIMNTRADSMNPAGAARTKVLVIDDDERLNALLTRYMDRFGFSVRSAIDPKTALRALKIDPPDIVILDIMLPEMDGFAVCRKVRETSCVPIIMLTARGDVMDRIVGLELGADDYLAKPFEPRELVARVQAVLRRGLRRDSEDRLCIGTLEVDWSTRCARIEGHDIGVTTAEFELLGLLVRNRGKVLSRERILDGTRGIDWEAYDRSIDVLISRLRLKLGDDSKHPSFIRTVRGAGYIFIGGNSA